MKTVPILKNGGSPVGVLVVIAALAAAATTACSPSNPTSAAGGKVVAVATEDFWGSLLRQLGGDRASVSSIVSSPNVDPHDYDPTSSDGVRLATAKLVVVNGLGYDAWADKLLSANPVPGRIVINIGKLVGARSGDNPHQWYSPADVHRVNDEITADLKRADPAHAEYFDAQHAKLATAGLKAYDDLRAEIREQFAGTPIGISESIFAPMATDLGLPVLTPPTFANATAEGNEPTAGDKQTVDRQISTGQVKVFVYNAQNSTPDVTALVNRARQSHVEVVRVTETLTPEGATFQDWQATQLTQLRAALAAATGR